VPERALFGFAYTARIDAIGELLAKCLAPFAGLLQRDVGMDAKG
jgi:hypothetical protein